MKSVVINGIEYHVGDKVYYYNTQHESEIDFNNLNFKTIKYITCGVISKITQAGYIYVKHDNNAFYYSDKRFDKNGEADKYYHFQNVYYKNVLKLRNGDIDNAITKINEQKDYIQNTFKRLKDIHILTYDKAQKINTLLDEIGIDKVTQE